MLIPLIVIGVLFLITWLVIVVSATPMPVERGHDSHGHCPEPFLDPFHKCSYTRLQTQLGMTRSELGSLRSRLSYVEEKQRSTHGLDILDELIPKRQSPDELLRLLGLEPTTPPKQTRPPKEITIKNANYKLVDKEPPYSQPTPTQEQQDGK